MWRQPLTAMIIIDSFRIPIPIGRGHLPHLSPISVVNSDVISMVVMALLLFCRRALFGRCRRLLTARMADAAVLGITLACRESNGPSGMGFVPIANFKPKSAVGWLDYKCSEAGGNPARVLAEARRATPISIFGVSGRRDSTSGASSFQNFCDTTIAVAAVNQTPGFMTT